MPNKQLPRDVFLYLLVAVTLTMSAVSLGFLLADLVNIYLPDPIRPVCAYDSCAGSLNTEIAVLLVSFPVLVAAWRFLQRDVRKNPDKSDLWVRRWMLYLTLFVSAITAIVDSISLVSSWLGGELTLPFLIKILIVLWIALTIFYYFLRELHGVRQGKHRMAAWLGIVVVVGALVGGVITSAPWEARQRNNDRDRVTALDTIQWRTIDFWTSKGRLPVNLSELSDSVSGFVVPLDPATQRPYEYTRKGSLQFQLCATFETDSLPAAGIARPSSVGYLGIPNTWDHGIGRTCFDRTIDPELYPIKR